MHVEWGEAGLRECARAADTVVIVDVLSFCTSVSVAVDRGALVYPMRVGEQYAPQLARRLGAHLAGPRGDRFSLSPLTVGRLQAGERIVLPSPNGGGLSLAAARRGMTVVAGSLRNASAVAAWLREQRGRFVVLAAGERWRDGSLRFATEDFLGAGAILSELDPDRLSPEALVAAAAFRAARAHLAVTIRDCTSGQELAADGYTEDLEWAADLDVSGNVPILVDNAFKAA